MTQDREDFKEIMHAGGNLTIKKRGSKYAIDIAGNKPNKVTITAYRMSIEGFLFDHNLFVPTDSNYINKFPLRIIILSDEEGYFGRSCPNCKKYFRVKGTPFIRRCPYCDTKGPSTVFTTINQRQYIEALYSEYLIVLSKEGDVDHVIDFDNLIDNLDDNKSPLVYSDQSQQRIVTCTRCKLVFDIKGHYGACPDCGKRNCIQVFHENVSLLEDQFVAAESKMNERNKRENEWKTLINSMVSEFEALGNELKRAFDFYPMTPHRRKLFNELSFQRIEIIFDCFEQWFDINIFRSLKYDDIDFIKRMFQRRHLYTHKNGLVDKDYLTKTNDSTVSEGEYIRPKSKQVKRMMVLIKQIGDNLFNEFESIDILTD